MRYKITVYNGDPSYGTRINVDDEGPCVEEVD